jgi:hypothetical protein
MRRVVIDTNVPVIANGAMNNKSKMPASLKCQISAVEALFKAVNSQCILLDLEGNIQNEYQRYLNAKGQPGVGDQFFRHILNSIPSRVERLSLPKRCDGEYSFLPQEIIDCGFDRSDRKFAALAKQAGASVINAVDSDWVQHGLTLSNAGIEVENVCGTDCNTWFTRQSIL